MPIQRPYRRGSNPKYQRSASHTLIARRNTLTALLALCMVAPALNIAAQQPTVRREVIAGVVRDTAGRVIVTGEVLITLARTFDVVRAVVSTTGTFRAVVDSGTSDYLVAVVAPGFQGTSRRATLPPDRDSLFLEFKLSAGVSTLSTVQIAAVRPRARDVNNVLGARGGADEQMLSESFGALGAGESGDLLVSASLNPSLTSENGGVGALGLGGDQSRISINGLATGLSTMPRDMRRRVRAGTTNYDPAIGGFSAALVSVELQKGSLLTVPQFRLSFDGDVDGIATASRQSLTGRHTVASYTASGEAIPDKIAYNVGVTVARRDETGALLGALPSPALVYNGVSGETTTKLAAAAARAGVPFNPKSGSKFANTSADFLGRFDWLQGRFGPIAITAGAGFTNADQRLNLYQNGTRGATSQRANGSLQLASQRTTAGEWLVDWRVGGTLLSSNSAPDISGPGIVVRVASDSSADLTGGLGGSGDAQVRGSRSSLEAALQGERIVRLPLRGTHQVKLFLQQQTDFGSERQAPSSGTYTFASLEDFSAGTPQAYARLLNKDVREAGASNVALGVGDLWKPSRYLTLQLGIRAEVGGRLGKLSGDSLLTGIPAVAETQGRRWTTAFSPRAGFQWAYRKAKATTPSITSTPISAMAFPGTGILRGGVGIFRSYWNVSELLSLSDSRSGYTARQLYCGVGNAPQVAWFAGVAQAPESCTDGTTGHNILGVTTLAAGAKPPAAWRGNVTLTHEIIPRLTVEAGVVLSYGFHQRVAVDRNLPNASAFTLLSEAGRPSFRAATDIDSLSGFPNRDVVRPISGIGAVLSRDDIGRNRARQFTLALLPDIPGKYQARVRTAYTQSESYTNTFLWSGTELLTALTWQPSQGVPRFRTSAEFARVGRRLIVAGVLQHNSGVRYTPLVSGDVNGDGRAFNDRAYVAPGMLSGPEAARFPEPARHCLVRQSGSIVAIGSCTSPSMVRADLAVTLLPNPWAFASRGGRRVTYTFRIANIPALLDQMLHSSPVGWGSSASIDPVLLDVRGFNAQTHQFSYAVNPNFGRAPLGARARQAPYLLSFDAQVFLGRSRADQQASRTLWRSRVATSPRANTDSIVANLRSTFDDPYQQLLDQGDSLLLQRAQVEAIQHEQRALAQRTDSVWRRVGEKLANRQNPMAESEAGAELERAYGEVIKLLQAGVRPLRTILVPAQIKLVPSDVTALLNGREPLYHLRR